MKERPILFSGEMVRAILRDEDPKTQTRRVVKPQPTDRIEGKGNGRFWTTIPSIGGETGKYSIHEIACPYGRPGDRLWVRETFADLRGQGFPAPFGYAADCRPGSDSDQARKDYGVKWKPSIFMPRWASRIELEVVDVRVERVQAITEDDAKAEGVIYSARPGSELGNGYRNRYRELWDELNAKRGHGWDRNPWVWVVKFERIKPCSTE